VLRNDGPRLRAIDAKLAEAGLAPNKPGKGRNVWFCIGHALASRSSDVVAPHDGDIVTYIREMLARLVYPVANPVFSYQFCKGYHAPHRRGEAQRPRLAPAGHAASAGAAQGDLTVGLRRASARLPLSAGGGVRDAHRDPAGHADPLGPGPEIGVLSEV
jgi:glucosyl-3-phosphoglycerate synthase